MAEAEKITGSPEFDAAVQKHVEAKVAEILGKFNLGEGKLSDENVKFAESLAMAMAKLTEQGTGRRYVAPEILRTRDEARTKMFDAIVNARKSGKVPSYKVVAKTLLDNQVVEPFWVDANHVAQHTEIDWPGVPNDAMAPLNDAAKEIFRHFLDSVGSKPQYVTATGALVDAPDAMQEGYGVTAKGLVVRGGAVPRQNRPAEHADQASEQGLSLHHRNKQPVKETRVLGTIAAPARQVGP